MLESKPVEKRPGCPAVAVIERMDVPDKEVKDDRLDNRMNEFVVFIRKHNEIIDPCRDFCTSGRVVIDLRRTCLASNNDIVGDPEIGLIAITLQSPQGDLAVDLKDEFAGQRLVPQLFEAAYCTVVVDDHPFRGILR